MTREAAIRFAEYAQIMADGKPDVQEFYRAAELALRAQQERENLKQITNADRIRAMRDEELAWELMLWRCEAVAKFNGISGEYPDTQKTILDWLQQPAEGG